ncbi:RecF/RecN/SMC N terminal domain-containing protein [Gymnopilus junonius]|uniref:Structural maintenance of chromosomes protein 4 n=1 Tax=Gymnopilus junonius TaxID=109634 RepID=A0A9P5N6Y6_GYMJU|nr:RecF/RecN/SMC N terminal domain-containing protein [Gymnopilus junonius]
MPPRRSSRAPSASVEPTPIETLPAKRKRGQRADPEVEEKENAAKPPSRTRRGSSVRSSVPPPSKARKSSRSQTSLPDVAESDNEEQSEAPPPVKKARPSNEHEVKEESAEEEEVEVKPKRGRRAASVAKSTRAADMDVDEETPSKPASRRTSSRKAAVSFGSRTTTSVGSAKSGEASGSARVEEPVVDISEEEDVKPAKGRRSTKRAPSKSLQSDDEDGDAMSDYNEDGDVKPARRGRKAKAPVARKGKAPAKPAPVEEGSDEDLEPPPPAQPRIKSSQKAAVEPTPEVEEEEEEEKSLFDPPPAPSQSTLPPPPPEEPAGPKARLVIHKMALVNFKSYAGRQEIGPFHKSFSAIVGPNGSGKSNTIDALLFVFGFRASKMRQGKISELIHNSANYPDLQDCSVEIHFREIIDSPGSDSFKVVSGSQLVVARTAYKDNSSKYAINEKTSSYKEVQTLLKGRGIDLDHNRFLILQGEVESIAQMKPKAPSEHEDGLLEYLEDIIGTSKYKEPIDEAMVEMERLQEDRQMKLNRLRHVESEKQALEAKKKEAEDFLRLKNEHVRAQSRLFQWTLMRCLELEEKLATQLEKLQKELEKETEQNRGDIDHLEQLKEHYEEREKAYAEVQAAAATAVKDLATLERREVGLQEKRKHASGRAKKLKKSVQEDTTARKTALNVIEDSTSKIKKEKQKLEEHELSLEEEEKVLEEIRDSLKDKTQVFHDKIQVKQKELQPWTTKINKKQADVDVATSERDALAKKAEALKEQCKEANETLQTLLEEREAKKLQIQKDVQAGDQRLKGAQSRVNELKGKAANARSKVDEVKANQSENRSRNNVLDSLTSLKIVGRLGSLGTIPDKYDVAISTACGANLNFMVVDRVAQAQSCIEYMRKNNVGRASFMILEKIGQGNADKTPTPDGVPRLFDLVKPKDPIYAPAFFKAIGKHAQMAVVTLDGALIETSGAMSGGGSQLSRGAMSSKLAAATVTPEVLRSYERESDQAAQQYQKALADLRDAEQELERLKSREPEIDLAYQKVGMDIENLKRRIAEAEKRAKDLNAQNKPNGGDLARIKSLEQEIGAAATELDELKEKSAKVEQDIKDLEKKILEIGGSKLLSQRSKVDGLRLHMKLANDEITKAEEADAEMEELDAEMKKVANHIAELKEEVESAQAAAENSKEDLDNLKAQLDEQEARIAKFRQKELKLRNSISDTKKDIDENNRATEHYTELHDELTLEEIDEDDEDEEEQAASPEAPQTSEHPDGEAQVKVEAGAEGEPRQKAMPEKRKSTAAPSNELQIYSTEELRKYNRPELIANTEYLDEKIKKARPDLSVLKEYKQREQEFFNRAQDLDKVTAERDAQKAKYEGLRKQRLDEFMAGFNLISLKLKEMYQMITLGGNAELELVDSMDPFSEGIIFSVMPPKKSWKNISNLSGGEKTLSSLALVFALHVFKPTPLYFMDEIDAALDFRNVSIVANYIKDRTKNAQFIIISLRNDMFELSHRLIGIYKTSNATRSISIDNHALQTTIPPPRPSANVVA